MQLENLGPISTSILAVGEEMSFIHFICKLAPLAASQCLWFLVIIFFCDFKLSFVIKNKHLLYLQLDNIVLNEKQ